MKYLLIFSIVIPNLIMANTDAEKGKVKFKNSKEINFEELLIQGQIKRPEISIVTGNENKEEDSLLKLRENFTDRMAMDFGEEIK